ncbi:QWRF motif-containing protein 6 [Zea mays]|uniref:QWRF motif-containing protein 6 n=1 Tax=Zea mays TaxID=4577 RepID=A0A1D6KXU7_MAIZE|nr:QWRF motif-containing protein 6 [Zea mays]
MRPSTRVRTSFTIYSASHETSAAAIDSRPAASCPRHVPFPELRTSPPWTRTTEGPGRPPNPFCFQALASALPDRQAKTPPPAAVKPAPVPVPARKKVLAKKGAAAAMGGSKDAGKQEDVHRLRILDNCYMQYRFLNAHAEAAAIAKKDVAEKTIYGLSERIANMQKYVAQKKAELECLKRMEKVHFVVDSQANTGEVKLALNSAMEIMKQLSPCVDKLSRKIYLLGLIDYLAMKVGETEDVASELSNVVSDEQVLLQECADLLHQAHDIQAMEDSLKSQVMQLTKNKT